MEKLNSEENFINTRKKERDAAKKYFEDEYDQDSRQELTKEEYIEREMLLGERDELENVKMRGEVELKASRSEVEEWKEKWRQDRIDDVTGLEIRKILFERMRKRIYEIFEISKEKKQAKSKDDLMTEKEAIFNKLINKNSEDLKNENLTVMMADVSFLSLVNEAGHEAGDKLLSEISKEVKERVDNSYRHGGDEITGLFDIADEEIEKKISELKASVEKIDIEKIKEYNLTPNLDIGKAHISEAVLVFQKIAEEGGDCEKKLRLNPVKELENVMVAIADKRSFIDKGKKRIALLAEKYNENKEAYSDMVGFLRKGGYNIKDEEVEVLNEVVEKKDKAGMGEWIEKFIRDKEESGIESLSGSDDKFNYIKAKMVFEYIWGNDLK